MPRATKNAETQPETQPETDESKPKHERGVKLTDDVIEFGGEETVVEVRPSKPNRFLPFVKSLNVGSKVGRGFDVAAGVKVSTINMQLDAAAKEIGVSLRRTVSDLPADHKDFPGGKHFAVRAIPRVVRKSKTDGAGE